MLEDAAGHLCAPHVQVFQVGPLLEKGDAAVGEVFTVVAVQVNHVAQRLKVFQAQIGDLCVGEVEAPQLG